MALTQELINNLIINKGNVIAVTHLLNEYNSQQEPYNRLNGEDILNAYKLSGLYTKPINIIKGNIYDEKIGIYRFGNHI